MARLQRDGQATIWFAKRSSQLGPRTERQQPTTAFAPPKSCPRLAHHDQHRPDLRLKRVSAGDRSPSWARAALKCLNSSSCTLILSRIPQMEPGPQ